MRTLLAATTLATAVVFVTTRDAARLDAPDREPGTGGGTAATGSPAVTASGTAGRIAKPLATSLAAPPPDNIAMPSAPPSAAAPPSGQAPASRRSRDPVPAARGGGATPANARPAQHIPSPGSRAVSDAIASAEAQANGAPLARLYLAYFHRAPDYEGFDYYVGEREDGATLDEIADEFAASAEFTTRYGDLDNASFVDRVHRNVMGSPADMAQRAFWVEQLDAGRMTRGQVMLAFSESAEFQSLSGNEVFVTLAYAEALRREPAPADFARWVDFLDAGHPRTAVIEALLAGRPPARP